MININTERYRVTVKYTGIESGSKGEQISTDHTLESKPGTQNKNQKHEILLSELGHLNKRFIMALRTVLNQTQIGAQIIRHGEIFQRDFATIFLTGQKGMHFVLETNISTSSLLRTINQTIEVFSNKFKHDYNEIIGLKAEINRIYNDGGEYWVNSFTHVKPLCEQKIA